MRRRRRVRRTNPGGRHAAPGDHRPIRDDDEARFRRLWPRLSAETRYRRFHAPVHRLPAAFVSHLVHVDHDAREAVVALVGGEVVGVARYDRSPTDPTEAEFAVLVEDDWQNVGVGRQLVGELTRLAAERDVRVLTATVQADNDRMVWLIRRLLPGAHLTAHNGVYDVRGPVEPAAALTPR